MNNQELWEIVNPVFNTAKSCVQIDAASGDEDSKQLLGALGFEPFGSQTSKKPIPPELAEQVKRLFPAYMILLETRFQTMNRLAESRPACQIADLPCGYTARGIRMSRQGRVYYGLDLPAVIDTIRPAAASLIGENSNIRYCAVDATNYDSLKKAFPDTARNLMFTTEGLLMYFNQSELEEVFSAVRRILQQYGGSWVIADRAYFLYDKEVVAASLKHDPRLTALYSAVTKQAAATTADVTFNNNVFFDPDDEKVRAFIRSMGFELTEVCMADFLPDQLGALGGDQEADEAVRKVFQKMMFWELTVRQAADKSPASDDKNLPFAAEGRVEDGVFRISIQGRMDTITAPELLKLFQETEEKIRAIHVDVSRMEYVSSAGLRVLLMMYKSLEDKELFEMTGVNEAVREILETTGFDQFLL
ncbi:MAG: STAS domain-containing protein [Clostridia bacterium]|nr:STAS domain-containing protein [Clostridia bacterium]